MNEITTLGIDIAKNVFQLCGVDRKGKVVLSKRVGRKQLTQQIVQLPTDCRLFMEACATSHVWARRFMGLGYQVKLIAPQFVKPYVRGNKNDRNDAAGLVEAGLRPQMRFVPIKTLGQQDMQSLHRARALVVRQRTMLSNQLRGLLAEYGVILSQGIGQVRVRIPSILEEVENGLTDSVREVLADIYELFCTVDKTIKHYTQKIEHQVKQDEVCQRLIRLPGVGPLVASAFVTAVGSGKDFRKGREVSAWLGLTPKHKASGHKLQMQGISKRGDVYVRTLLIHGCRSVLKYVSNKEDKRSRWAASKKAQLGYNKAAVALANKTAREMWAVLAKGEAFNFSI